MGTLPHAREQLLEILREKALVRLGSPVQLASGGWSSEFIDAKRALAAWDDLRVVSEAIVGVVHDRGYIFDAVGGLTLGADALSIGIAAVSNTRWFVVRKEPKNRGTRKQIEGAVLLAGDQVLLVDDVVTTGRSMLQAYDTVKGTGAVVVAAVTLVDRGDTARQCLQQRGVAYLPMATYQDMGIDSIN